ncbi:MAG: alpha/beta hydrolase [Myxococcota bacterium]|jgi:pimeloyl-ACP methyl ester carboxylesterase|nr:alpha/beta hydrolase [Myxococcota bacterium]
MPYADLGGTVLRYRVIGAGPPLLLIRGLARCAEYWLGFEDELARDHQVILVDTRGVGGSDVPPPPYTTAAMADDLARLLAHLGLSPVHVFGLSLGGMVAQQLALRYPYRVARLAIGCCSPGPRLGGRLDPVGASKLLTAFVLPGALRRRLVAEVTLSLPPGERRTWVIQRWEELGDLWPVPVAGLLGQLAAAALHDPGPALGRVHLPCLILHGTEDRLLPLVNAQRLAEVLPAGRLEILPGAGHDLVAEQPERVARLLRSFLS